MSEDIHAKRSELGRLLLEQASVIADLLGILPIPVAVPRKATLPDAVVSMRHAADALYEQPFSEANHLALHAVEMWIAAAILVHARSHHGKEVELDSARFLTANSYDLAGRAVVALGGLWPPANL